MNDFFIKYTWDNQLISVDKHANVSVKWLKNGNLSINIDAPFANDPKPVCENTACWGLWNYEVVELFLVGEGNPTPYTEIEISPWGNHLVLQLLGYRNVIEQELPLNIINVKRDAKRWQAHAIIDADLIPKGLLKVNAFRVSGVEPNRDYHVMTPMKGLEPDFHHIDQFTQELMR